MTKRRPIAVVKTEGKTREQMKAEAREAMRQHFAKPPDADDSDADS